MKYVVPVRFTGRIMFEIQAENEDEARQIANALAEEVDFGNFDFEDIEWEVKPAIEQYK